VIPDGRRPIDVLLNEPFRLFFPLGAAFGFAGVSHWVWYYAGITTAYSCTYHGLFQIQVFEAAFFTGFTLTALPRFIEAPPTRLWELVVSLLLLCGTATCLTLEAWGLAQAAFAGLILHLVVFFARRYRRRGEDPPADFLLVPFGLLHALVGAVLVAFPLPGFVKLGHNLVQQGTLLCFVLAFGAYLGPRLLLGAPPDDIPGGGRRRAYLAALVGSGLFVSFFLDAGGLIVPGRLLRATVATVYAFVAIPILRRPAVRLFHVRTLWHTFWFVLVGLWLATAFPDYDIVSLHLTFIGGFSLLTLTVASRVVAAHCGFESLWTQNTRTLIGLGCLFSLALLSRLLADFVTWYYFGMLHIAAGFWLTGIVVWAITFVPRMLPRHVSPD